jgi:hypothetical protein
MDPYYCRKPEVLARAFEACLQAHACERLGIPLSPIEMHSDILNTEASAPRGRELAAAREAFKAYFAAVGPLAAKGLGA